MIPPAEADRLIAEQRARIVELQRELEAAKAHHGHLATTNDSLALQLRGVVEERERLQVDLRGQIDRWLERDINALGQLALAVRCPACGQPAQSVTRIGDRTRGRVDERGQAVFAVHTTPGLVKHADGTECGVPDFDVVARDFQRLRIPDDVKQHVADGLEQQRLADPAAAVMFELGGKLHYLGAHPIAGSLQEWPPGWLNIAGLEALLDGITNTMAKHPELAWLAMHRKDAALLVATVHELLRAQPKVARGRELVETAIDTEARRVIATALRTALGEEYVATVGGLATITKAQDKLARVWLERQQPRAVELLRTVRGRLAHASEQLAVRAQPAPEVDDVGAACAVLAEDLDGIVAEIDGTLGDIAVDRKRGHDPATCDRQSGHLGPCTYRPVGGAR